MADKKVQKDSVIPAEGLKMDSRSIQMYEDALRAGKEMDYSIRVMVVGQFGVGKTTLIKRLLGRDVNINERISTEGIDVYTECCKVSLATGEWITTGKDEEQYSRLRRLVKVLNEHVQKQESEGKEAIGTSIVNIGPESTIDIGDMKNEKKKDLTMEMLQMVNENYDRLEQNVEEYAALSLYDFAGQYSFHTTHQIFLTRHAIYLLVIDLSQLLTDLIKDDECFFDIEGIRQLKAHEMTINLLNSIHSCSPSHGSGIPHVILVGTHVDKIPEKSRKAIIDSYFQGLRYMVKDSPIIFHLMDDIAIDITLVDPMLEVLKRRIFELASQQPHWGQEKPARWLPLEQSIMRLKNAGLKVVPISHLEEINRSGSVRIESSDEMELFLQFQHEIGTILYFRVEGLREKIFPDPQWIIDAYKSLITSEPFILRGSPAIANKWFEFKTNGILTQGLIDAIWSKENHPDFHDNKEYILMIMEWLLIIARPRSFSEDGVKEENYYIAPSMLREGPQRKIITPDPNFQVENSSVLGFVFIEKYLPSPIFHRLLASCIAQWPIARRNAASLIFCGCCVFDLDIHHRLTLYFRDYIIFAKVTRMAIAEKTQFSKLCTEARLFICVQLSKIIGSLGHNLKFELHVKCPASDADSPEGLYPVSLLQHYEKFVCHSHDESHILVSQEMLQFWFDEMEESGEGDLSLPLEILKMDDNAIKIFKEALKDKEEVVNNIRIMVVGHPGVGKTTLIKRLLRKDVDIKYRCSTEGIDVHINCCGVSLKTSEWNVEQTDSKDVRLLRLNKILHEHTKKENVTNETENKQVPYAADEEQNENDDKLKVQDTKETEEIKKKEVDVQQQTPLNVQTLKDETCASKQQIRPNIIQSRGSQSSNQNKMLFALGENYHKVPRYKGDHVSVSIWDFAGQNAFYTTHQMFLTRRAIYLLVSDVSQNLYSAIEDKNDPVSFDCNRKTNFQVHELVEVWLNLIHSCADPLEPGVPPVILVGTHVDKIRKRCQRKRKKTSQPYSTQAHGPQTQPMFEPMEGIAINATEEAVNKACENYFKDIRSHLQDKPTRFHVVDETFAIDNNVIDEKLEKLKTKIVEIASQQSYWGEKIPARWLLLEDALMNEKDKGCKVISYNEVQKLNNKGEAPIQKSEELDLFLKFLHETGTIIYFSIEVLRDNIVLDPVWLIDALKSLINAQPILPLTKRWFDFKEKGKLRLELVDEVWTKENYPELHANKKHILLLMQQLSIIATPMSFNEKGMEKKKNYFLTPCMLHKTSPNEVIHPKEDPRMVSTSVLHFDFTGKFLPLALFHRLLAACITRWKVAKKESENLIFCGCCIFNLDLFHRLTLYLDNHIISARITVMVDDKIKIPDAKLCSRVKRFITLNLFRITSYLGPNLQFELCIRCQPYQMWLADEGHDPDASISPEHMNHARLCVALMTVCGKAMREILSANLPAPCTNISQALLAKRTILTTKIKNRRLLNNDQINLVFPDPQGQKTGTVDQFDHSLLYTLIRNVSTVPIPSTGWGNDPQDQPRDRSLGASVERIRSFRNHVSGHSPDAKMSEQNFKDYWNKLKAVLQDIEDTTGKRDYIPELTKQEQYVISVYEAM